MLFFLNMAHINDLDPKVLYQILYLASGELAENIDKWKHKLYLLQVCTKWYGLLKYYIYSQGFVAVYSMSAKRDPEVNLKSCIYYAENRMFCRSNLGIITGRDKHNCDCVSELEIKVSDDLHISRYGSILKKLSTLGIRYWLNLSSLVFYKHVSLRTPLGFKRPNIMDISLLMLPASTLNKLSETASRYIRAFQIMAPNIKHLELVDNNDIVLSSAFSILIDHYAQRLQRLHFNHPIKFPLPLFSVELTSLLLNLNYYTYQHTSFHAKPLQHLQLRNISSSQFLWWIFHDFTSPGYIEFTNLKTLDLSYSNQIDKEQRLSDKFSIQARPYGSHMLRFPKLKHLILIKPPVDCDVFYTDTIPMQLDGLNIQGDCNSVIAASRLRFTRVNNLSIGVNVFQIPNNDFYIAADRYFGYTEIGSSFEVDFQPPIVIQRTTSWVNVTDLRLSNIELNGLLRLIPNLYRLRNLIINSIHLSDECLSIIQSGLEEEAQREFKILETKIEYLKLHYIELDNSCHLFALLNYLLLRTTSLRKIDIGQRQNRIVVNSFLLEKYPHIDFS